MRSSCRFALALLLVSSTAALLLEAEVGRMVRGALLDAQSDDVPLDFDHSKLVNLFPDAKRTKLAERLAPNAKGPGVLLDIAFAHPAEQGEEAVHSSQQEALQIWLFGLCNRLPMAGSGVGMRRECTQTLATYASAVKMHGAARIPSKLRAEAVVALGLGRKATYYFDEQDLTEEKNDLQQAKSAAIADGELQSLMRRPNVKAALERIAANPSAMASEKDPDVLDALQKLNGLLKG